MLESSESPTGSNAFTSIYKPTKTATQSGNWQGHHWRMDWDILSKGHRWENPLMGWQSSGDFMQGTHLYFKSREDAIAFAEKQGYVSPVARGCELSTELTVFTGVLCSGTDGTQICAKSVCYAVCAFAKEAQVCSLLEKFRDRF